jgi:hypothetical protein
MQHKVEMSAPKNQRRMISLRKCIHFLGHLVAESNENYCSSHFWALKILRLAGSCLLGGSGGEFMFCPF